jgi:uncharacterized membrane protein YraQ (UPF0718 family)
MSLLGDLYTGTDFLVGGFLPGGAAPFAPLRAADWLAMQVPGLVGAGLTGLSGGDAGTALSNYETNLNAGLGFAPAPTGYHAPTWSDIGNAIPGGINLATDATVHTIDRTFTTILHDVAGPVSDALGDLLKKLGPWLLAGVAAAVVVPEVLKSSQAGARPRRR